MTDLRHHPGWRLAATLAVTETVSWGILYYAFAVFLDPMVHELGASRGTVSGAYALGLLTSGLAAPLVGRWVDEGRARVVMTLGAMAAVGVVVAWSLVQSVLTLYLVWGVTGLVMACVLYEPAMAVITRAFPSGAQRPLLLLTLVAGFASTIFLPLSGVLLDHLGWRAAVGALAVVLAVATVVPHAVVLRHDRLSSLPGTLDGGSRPSPTRSRDLAADATFRWMTLAFTLATITTVVVSVHLVAVLTDRGMAPGLAATAAGGLGLLSVTGRAVLTLAERRWSFATLMAGVFAAQAVGLVLLVTVQGSVIVVTFVLVYGAGFGAMTIARPVILAALFGVGSFGRVSGTLHGILTVAKAAAPLAAGIVVTRAGAYTPVLWSLVAVNTAATCAMLPVVRDPRLRRQPVEAAVHPA